MNQTKSSARIYLHYLTFLNIDGNRLKYTVHDKTISEYLLLIISRTRKIYQPCPRCLRSHRHSEKIYNTQGIKEIISHIFFIMHFFTAYQTGKKRWFAVPWCKFCFISCKQPTTLYIHIDRFIVIRLTISSPSSLYISLKISKVVLIVTSKKLLSYILY